MRSISGRLVVCGARLSALACTARLMNGIKQLRDADRARGVGLCAEDALEVQQLALAGGVCAFGLLDDVEQVLYGVLAIRGGIRK